MKNVLFSITKQKNNYKILFYGDFPRTELIAIAGVAFAALKYFH